MCKLRPTVPVCVTVEGSGLADGALPLVTAVHAVQLVVAAVLEGEADGPAAVVVRAVGHAWSPTGEVALRAAHAGFFVAARGGTVPVSVTPLLLRVAAAVRAPAHTLPRQAVACDAVGGVKASGLCGGHNVVDQGEDTSAGLHLQRFEVGRISDLLKM